MDNSNIIIMVLVIVCLGLLLILRGYQKAIDDLEESRDEWKTHYYKTSARCSQLSLENENLRNPPQVTNFYPNNEEPIDGNFPAPPFIREPEEPKPVPSFDEPNPQHFRPIFDSQGALFNVPTDDYIFYPEGFKRVMTIEEAEALIAPQPKEEVIDVDHRFEGQESPQSSGVLRSGSVPEV